MEYQCIILYWCIILKSYSLGALPKVFPFFAVGERKATLIVLKIVRVCFMLACKNVKHLK